MGSSPPTASRLEADTPPYPADIAVGTDLVLVSHVESSIANFGDRYLQRVYTEGELDYCLAQRDGPALHLAARFAAKEATIKALAPGVEALGWRSIEIRRRPGGACDVVLHGPAHLLARRRGVRRLAISMSHDGEYATAVVLAERRRTPPAEGRLRRKVPRGAYER
ncbi:MAG TPA: holo-ACP synthase [Polyangiaceae bacterium]|nr:holo-ACP synthase [Polyangiaceae bacterium]